MSHTIVAVYENGVFRPLEPVDYPERQCVTVTPVQEPVAGTGSETASVHLQEPDTEERPWRGVFAIEVSRTAIPGFSLPDQPVVLKRQLPDLNLDWFRSHDDTDD